MLIDFLDTVKQQCHFVEQVFLCCLPILERVLQCFGLMEFLGPVNFVDATFVLVGLKLGVAKFRMQEMQFVGEPFGE